MPLQLLEIVNLLAAIIVLCFSFSILVSAIWFKKNVAELPRLIGFSHISIFLLYTASLFISNPELKQIFSQFAEPVFLMVLFVFLLPRKNKFSSFTRALPVLLPASLALMVLLSTTAQSMLIKPVISLTALTIPSILILYLLQHKRGAMSVLFWSVLSLLTSGFARYYLTSGLTFFIAPSIKLVAFSLLLYYFYLEFLKSLLAKVEESESKLAVINRSFDVVVQKRMVEIEKVNQKLVNLSKTDGLSNVLNKAAILDSIEKLIIGKQNSEFSILMFDIDHFKNINDKYGHVKGDKCIKALAAIAKNSLREFDMIGRFGGDEFIIVLPKVAYRQAYVIAERFRKQVETSADPHYTISIGISSYPSDGNDVKTLIEAADKGLYLSKENGRNAVSHKSFQ